MVQGNDNDMDLFMLIGSYSYKGGNGGSEGSGGVNLYKNKLNLLFEIF